MKEEPNNPSIDPELEARIVALVLGEASDFEREQLNRLIEERPELAAFQREIQSVHGLLRDVGAGDSIADDDDWKLSAQKRNAVLAAISPEAKEQPEIRLTGKSPDQRRSNASRLLANIAKIAAVLLVAGSLGSMAVSQWFKANARIQVASSRAPHLLETEEFFMGEASAPGAKIFMSDGAVPMIAEAEAAEAKTTGELDYGDSSKSSLWAIRESLGADVALPSPPDLMDDVQHLPVRPKLNLPSEVAASGETRAADEPRSAPGAGVNGPGPGLSLPTVDDVALVPQYAASSGRDPQQDRAAWQDSDFFYSGLREGKSETGGEKASESEQPARFWDRHVVEGKPQSPSVLAMPALGLKASGDGQDLSQSRQSRRGGTKLDSSRDGSPAVGKEIAAEVEEQDDQKRDEQAGGERYRVDGIASAGRPGTSWSVELPEEFLERESGLFNTAESSKAAPAKPMVGGAGGGGGGRKLDADKAPDHDLDFDSGIQVPSIPSPIRKPMSSQEDLKKREVVEGFTEEFAKQGLALDESQKQDQAESLGRQIPVPVTGTPLAVPRVGIQMGQANQDGAWAYDAQPKTPLGGPAGLSKRRDEAVPEDHRKGGETYWERTESEQKSKRGKLLQQSDQLAGKEPSRGYRGVAPESTLEDDSKSISKGVPKFSRIAGDRITRDPVASDSPDGTKKTSAPAGLNEKTAAEETYSTFSLHVSDVSFKLARAALASGTWPEAAKVRIEEFVNAFDYGDPMPSQSEKVACRVEQSAHPFLQQRNVLRVSMRTAAAGRSSNTPLRLTLLLDNSGSMERSDRQQTVRRAFALLAGQLKPIDQVTLISFARQPRLLADKVSGSQSSQLVGLIENLPSEGGTNIEAALQLAFEKAREQQVDHAQNRIILLTDGAVNLGDANPESLSRMITTMRAAGIAFDAAGISAEGLNDEILEALTRKGDGRYYLLDSLEAADDGFARQIAGALRPSAGNVKVQIEFNPKRVGRYKLLGFQKHRLKKEDFRNDKVDAAEMAAAEAGVAVYQFEAKPDGEGDVGSVSVRFRDVSTGQMIENCWPIPYQSDAPRLDQAAPSLRIATCAALLAAKLRGEALGEIVDLKTLSHLIAGLPDQDRDADRVGQLKQMIEQARQVSGK